jgi:hypothetical protein
MSSWIGNQQYRPVKKGLYYQTTETGFCSLFNNLFYSYIYCKEKKVLFYILDKPNPIGLNYPIFQNILSNNLQLKYIKSPEKGLIKITRNDIVPFLTKVSNDFLRKEAIQFFKWSEEFQQKIQIKKQIFQNINFDIGIHIRAGDKITSGEMNKITIETYIQKVSSITKTSTPTIFLMSDTLSLVEEFKQKAPSPWNLYYFSSTILENHIQEKFNRKSTDDKLNALLQFMTELEIMKECPQIVCTFSSNVSRFLYLVHHNCEYHSLDLKLFSAF